jgi:hypothetical protein
MKMSLDNTDYVPACLPDLCHVLQFEISNTAIAIPLGTLAAIFVGHGASRWPVCPSAGKLILKSSATELSPYVPMHILAMFCFHQLLHDLQI